MADPRGIRSKNPWRDESPTNFRGTDRPINGPPSSHRPPEPSQNFRPPNFGRPLRGIPPSSNGPGQILKTPFPPGLSITPQPHPQSHFHHHFAKPLSITSPSRSNSHSYPPRGRYAQPPMKQPLHLPRPLHTRPHPNYMPGAGVIPISHGMSPSTPPPPVDPNLDYYTAKNLPPPPRVVASAPTRKERQVGTSVPERSTVPGKEVYFQHDSPKEMKKWLFTLARVISKDEKLARKVREAGKIHAPLDDKKKLGGDKQDGNGDGKGYSLTASTLGGTKPAVSVSGDLDFGTMELPKGNEDEHILKALGGMGLEEEDEYEANPQISPTNPHSENKTDQVKQKTFHLKNKSDGKVSVSVFLVPENKQFQVYQQVNGQGRDTSGVEGNGWVVEGGKTLDLLCSCGGGVFEGIGATWVMFVVRQPSVKTLTSIEPGSVHVVVRRVSVLNVYDKKAVMLDPEAIPFYPATLRTAFVHGAETSIVAPPPSLPNTPATTIHSSNRVTEFVKKRLSIDTMLRLLHNQRMVKPKDISARKNYIDYAKTLIRRYRTTGRDALEITTAHLNKIRMQLLLEEHAMLVELQDYDLFFTKITFDKNRRRYSKDERRFYTLSTPGVGEGRPAIQIGDKILLRPSGKERVNKFQIQVFIYRVQEKSIDFVLTPQLEAKIVEALDTKLGDEHKTTHEYPHGHICATSWHARFVLNQIPFQVMHAAIATLEENLPIAQRLFFPTFPRMPFKTYHAIQPLSNGRFDNSTHETKKSKSIWKESETKLNTVQKGAVEAICALGAMATRASKTRSGLGPFVVFGPPGTGKTTTVVEAMLKVLQSNHKARILACTPSDYSADILVERMKSTLSSKEMLRLNHPSRHTVVLSVKPYCSVDALGFYVTPSLAKLKTFRVIVTTCITSWRLLQAGVKDSNSGVRFHNMLRVSRGEFSHIFFDESSQAMEPEMAVPLCLADKSTVVVLAGDHRQLGALVHSPIASRSGLRISLQERLLTTIKEYTMVVDAANDNHVNGFPMCRKLIANYRSHPAILECFSALFYKNNLKPKGPKKITHSLIDWDVLPNKRNFPCFFHAIIAQDSYFPESGSLCNKSEADAIAHLIEKLHVFANQKGRGGLEMSDIGVIAPFRMQVILIRKVLRKVGMRDVRVGSVDDFQGKEAKVIFISTVISKDRPALKKMEDTANGIGIFSNPKRFNVAISRAKALMVVVGNPFILARKSWWKNILTYCISKKAYSGVDGRGEPNNEFLDIVQGSVLNLGGGETVDESMERASLYYSRERRWRIMA